MPPQFEIKNIFKEPFSTGKKVVIHSLFTCYFVNTPNMLNGGSISLFYFSQEPVFCE